LRMYLVYEYICAPENPKTPKIIICNLIDN